MSSFEQTMMGWSPQCYIPSFIEIGPPVPEKKIFEGFLAHLSRRLTGELIGYPWIRRPPSSVRPSSVVRPFTFSNIFSSETAWPIKAKFYVEPPWEGGTKVCINGPGHMTKMAAMPIMVKTFKNLLLQSRKSYDLETWYAAFGTQALQSLHKW